MAEYDEDTRQALAPIMEELGFALHTCQTFEFSLCLLLGLLAEHRLPSKGAALRESWDFHSPKPMGLLLSALRKEIEIPDQIGSFLKEGIRLRNYLIHDFFEDVGLRIIEPKARMEIVAEIRKVRSEIQRRDQALEPLTDALLKKYGVSTESLKDHAGELWD